MSIYLDNNATTEPLPEVAEAYAQVMKNTWGNPSSDHFIGSEARRVLEDSRDSVAGFFCVDPQRVVFTSGGTESNELAVTMGLGSDNEYACSVVEHSSVAKIAERVASSGGRVQKINVDQDGQVSSHSLQNALEAGCSTVSIQWANSETGVIQDIDAISNLCIKFGAALHVDAAQAVGRCLMDQEMLRKIDFLTFSGHKLHAPKGVGAIILGDNQQGRFDDAAGQEGGMRSGTENLPAIASLAVAMSMRSKNFQESNEQIRTLRDRFESKLLAINNSIRINGDSSLRLPNTTNALFAGIRGDSLIKRLDLENLFCSQTSACLMGRPEPSYVLTSMGHSEDEATSSIRFAFSIMNTCEEVDIAIELIEKNFHLLIQQSNLLAS